jgi:hypothetical protein
MLLDCPSAIILLIVLNLTVSCIRVAQGIEPHTACPASPHYCISLSNWACTVLCYVPHKLLHISLALVISLNTSNSGLTLRSLLSTHVHFASLIVTDTENCTASCPYILRVRHLDPAAQHRNTGWRKWDFGSLECSSTVWKGMECPHCSHMQNETEVEGKEIGEEPTVSCSQYGARSG